METQGLVEVKNLNYAYGERKVLEDICATFRRDGTDSWSNEFEKQHF